MFCCIEMWYFQWLGWDILTILFIGKNVCLIFHFSSNWNKNYFCVGAKSALGGIYDVSSKQVANKVVGNFNCEMWKCSAIGPWYCLHRFETDVNHEL